MSLEGKIAIVTGAAQGYWTDDCGNAGPGWARISPLPIWIPVEQQERPRR